MAKALRDFLRTRAPEDEANQLAKEITTSTARGAAMIAAAFLDEFVARLIRRHLVELTESEDEALFSPDCPLGTFSSRIKIARALAIFGPRTAHDLNLMREIRNAFAHGLRKMNFETREVKQLILSFHCLKDIENYKSLTTRKLFFEITRMLSTHLSEKGLSSPATHAPPKKLPVFANYLD
jgi:DNA-binding MltR family transcriptional regulator